MLLLFVNADANSTPSAVNGSSPFKRDNLRVAPLGLQKWRGKFLAITFDVVLSFYKLYFFMHFGKIVLSLRCVKLYQKNLT